MRQPKLKRSNTMKCQDELIAAHTKWLDRQIWDKPRYRITYVQPDKSAQAVASNDPSYLHEKAVELVRKGCRVLATERLVSGVYKSF